MVPYAELNDIRNVAMARSLERGRSDHINPVIRVELAHGVSKDTIILMSFDESVGRYIYADVAPVDQWLKLLVNKRDAALRAADQIINQHLENASRVP